MASNNLLEVLVWLVYLVTNGMAVNVFAAVKHEMNSMIIICAWGDVFGVVKHRLNSMIGMGANVSVAAKFEMNSIVG